MRYKDLSLPSDEYTTWNAMAALANWRIVLLPNGLYHGEYSADNGATFTPVIEGKTIEGVELKIKHAVSEAGNNSKRKANVPVVVKTFARAGGK